jgi:ribonuclease D
VKVPSSLGFRTSLQLGTWNLELRFAPSCRQAEILHNPSPDFGKLVYWRVIDTDKRLATFLAKVSAVAWIALDTEADSLHAYPEKLCLIQIAFDNSIHLLDPLAEVDFAPALKILQEHELVMHGADYDLRLLSKTFDFIPRAVFDTMLAARLLGERQFGLIHLVHQYLGVVLEKGPQKANWARRPLTERMENYALNDVRYLKPLADILRERLIEKGRLEWHTETCARLVQDCSEVRPTDPDVVWRVKGSHHLQPAALAVLRELWHWREKEAVRANKPPYFVLSPELMVHLSMAAIESNNVAELLPERFSPRRREGLLKAVAHGLAVEKPPGALQRSHYRQSELEKRRMFELERRRNRRASELGLDPTMIASRAMLVLLAKNWDDHQEELMDWQKKLLSA